MTATILGTSAVVTSTLIDAARGAAQGTVIVFADAEDPRAPGALAALLPGDTAIVNGDDGVLASLAATTAATVRTVGLSPEADIHAHSVDVLSTGTSFMVRLHGVDSPVRLRLHGEQIVVPALLAIAAALESGVPLETALERLGELESVGRWRMQALHPGRGVLVLNDAAEATAATMASALKSIALLTADRGRSVAVLGQLDSTPPDLLDDHDRIGRLVVRLNIRKLVVVGHAARHIHVAAGLEGSWDGESVLVDSVDEAYDLLNGNLHDGDVVLVKASASAGLGPLGDRFGEVGE